MKNQYEQLASNPDFLLAFSATDSANNALRSIILAGLTATGILAVKTTFTHVPTGHIGLMTRNGKILDKNGEPYGFKAVGLRKKIPLISGIKNVDMRERTTALGEKTYTLGNQASLSETDTFTSKSRLAGTTQQIANISVVWRILHGVDEAGIPFAYRQFMRLADEEKGLEQVVSSLVSSALVRTASVATVDQFRNEGFVYRQVRDTADQQLVNYGVGLVALRLEELTETPAQTLGSHITQPTSGLILD